MYKYILLDIDNTLLDFCKIEKQAMTITLERYGIDVSFVKRLSEITDSLWRMVERRELTPEILKIRRFEIFFKEFGINGISTEKIAEDYLNETTKHIYEFEASYDFCKKLFDMGKELYIVTNGIDFIQEAKISKASFRHFIKKAYISGKIGFYKPDKCFFDYVINDIGAKREDCLIIGDSLTSDILGGVNSGIDTCWFNLFNKKNTKEYSPTYTVTNINDVIDIIGEA